jgi:hypothetical protein
LLFLYISSANAEYTGLALSFEELDADWEFSTGEREARIRSVSFRIEEKTRTRIRIGLGLGVSNLRIAGDAATDRLDIDATSLGAYLRLPTELSENYSLNGLLSYRYYSGNGEENLQPVGIDWHELQVQLGFSVRLANIRITPFAGYYLVKGDIDYQNRGEQFELVDAVGGGIQLDYFVRDTAFIRLKFQSGVYQGLSLSFALRY